MRGKLPLVAGYVAMLVGGCGRLDFGASDLDGRGDAGAPVAAQTTCGRGSSAPDPVTIGGTTYTYTSFTTTMPIAGITTTATAGLGGATLATATSADDGSYALSIATGGHAQPIAITFANAAYLTTTAIANAPIDRDIAPAGPNLFELGQGPLWTPGEMGAVYGAVGVTFDMARATLSFGVGDCANNPIAGATVTIEPAGQLFYIDSTDDVPSMTATATTSPSSFVVGMSLTPGPTTISVTAPGYTFADQMYDVAAGAVTLGVAQPLE